MNKAIVDLFILDESSSMGAIKKSILEGYNEQVEKAKEQAESGKFKCFGGLVTFNSEVKIHSIAENVSELPKLDTDSYRPNGMTAMYDAIGIGVKALEEKLGQYITACEVVVTVLTDGQENSSQTWSAGQIKDLINDFQGDYGWVFTFMGANIDVETLGDDLGVSRDNTLQFVATDAGVKSAMDKHLISKTAYFAASAAGNKDSVCRSFYSDVK